MPNIKEIARRAKVSTATVSRALNDDPKVTYETKKLVHKIANELNYRPNIVARNFVKKTSNIIGLILPDITDEFFSELIKGVDEVSYQHNFFTMVISSHRYLHLENTLNSVLRNGLLGGMILLVPNISISLKNILSQTKIPFVIISGGSNSSSFDVVSIDNYQGAYDMTTYLIKKCGYTKIAHISGPMENDDAKLRIKAFKDACRQNDVNIPKNYLVEGDFTRESGLRIAMEMMSLKNKPEVIFAANDMMALGCYDAALKKGMSIPDDIGVVGFDDIFVSKYLNPPLTTVSAKIEDEGKRAAELLIEKIKSKSVNSYQSKKIKIATELVIRNSTKIIK
ncbi:MAG: LacI family DNA-binding transcriptional regulator [Ignavibacterium sp.]|uniref:LacI family DNA-binding transcriptional regulator n=1 Tax=Ignavibacterium sp. TaxID=2651167 RepID=UPI0040497D42